MYINEIGKIEKKEDSLINDILGLNSGSTKNNSENHMHAIAAGIPLMFANLGFRQANAMFKGNILALLIISFILIIALRSLRLGLLSIIPNVTPILVGFGFWAI